MKKILFITLISIAISGCSRDVVIDEPIVPAEVSFTIDYNIPYESGDMSRSFVYNDFYVKYIKTKILTPTTYNISFKNVNNGDSINVAGYWSKKQFINLTEGRYKVTGRSHSINSENKNYGLKNASNYIMSDTVKLYFDEFIDIYPQSTSLTFNAKYDCYLIVFDSMDLNSVRLNFSDNGSTWYKIEADKKDDFYFSFVKNDNFKKVLEQTQGTGWFNTLIGARKDGSSFSIDIRSFNFVHGKYYYFKDINGNLEVPPME